MGKFAEIAIELELAALGAGIEGRFTRSLERLRSYGPADLERDIRDLAQGELEIEDSFQARRIESPDAYGIGALFGDPIG